MMAELKTKHPIARVAVMRSRAKRSEVEGLA